MKSFIQNFAKSIEKKQLEMIHEFEDRIFIDNPKIQKHNYLLHHSCKLNGQLTYSHKSGNETADIHCYVIEAKQRYNIIFVKTIFTHEYLQYLAQETKGKVTIEGQEISINEYLLTASIKDITSNSLKLYIEILQKDNSVNVETLRRKIISFYDTRDNL